MNQADPYERPLRLYSRTTHSRARRARRIHGLVSSRAPRIVEKYPSNSRLAVGQAAFTERGSKCAFRPPSGVSLSRTLADVIE